MRFGVQRLTPDFLSEFAPAVTTSTNNGRSSSAVKGVDGHGDVRLRWDLRAKHSIIESINEDDSWLLRKRLARRVLSQRLSKRRQHDARPLGGNDEQGIQRCINGDFAQREGQNIALR